MMSDDNQKIMTLINGTIPNYKQKEIIILMLNERLDFGKRKYGHGVIINQNLDEYDNKWSSNLIKMDWPKMMLEEVLDGMIYTAAEILKCGDQNPKATYLISAFNNLALAAKSMLSYSA
jgi:hypothetical protein